MGSTRQTVALSGRGRAFDARVTAVRGDLADIALAGTHIVPHYAVPLAFAVIAPHSPVLAKPGGVQTSELLKGEHFMVLEIAGGFAWGFCAHDHYVGYVAETALELAQGAAPVAAKAGMVETALGLEGMPYLLGGRGGAGIDCSGLVQRSLAATGFAAPRDSDMQQAQLPGDLGEGAMLQRGDLVFFPGHVGIMADAGMLVHATAFHGKTVVEELAAVVARVSAEHPQAIVARKRLAA